MNKVIISKGRKKTNRPAYGLTRFVITHFFPKVLYIIGFALVFFSCKNSLFHTDTDFYTISPSLYLPQDNASSWVCEYTDPKGHIIDISIDNPFTDIVIEAPVNTIFPVRFRLKDSVSVIERCLNNQHLGLIFPFSDEMQTSDSAASYIFFKILTCSNNSPDQSMEFCSSFNWQRLILSLSKYNDPYSLDLDAAAADIAQGTFTSKSLKNACLK